MSDFEEAELARARKTKLLIAGGILSLVLPLLGVAYIKITDTSANSLPISAQGAVFDRRETTSQPLTPIAAAQPMAAPASSAPPAPGQKPGGSLGFISGGSDYYQDDKPAPKVGQAMSQAAGQAGAAPAEGELKVTGKNAAAPAAAAPAAKTAAKAQAATPQKKAWSPPRLNSSGGGIGAARFGPQVGSSAGGVGQSGVGGGGGMGGGAPGGAPGGMPPGMDMSALMGAAGGGAGGGAPDVGALMKNLPAGALPAGMPQMPPQSGNQK